MAYSDFTLDTLRHRFGLNIAFTVGAFASVPPVVVPPDVAATVQKYLPLAVGGGTEKARSEYLVAPIVGQIYYETKRQIVVLSGVEFNVDRTRGLHGFCDFLVSRSPGFITVDAPVVAIVEAKKEDLNTGVAQCLASMVAARVFNEHKNQPTPTVYGSVTSGTAWRFLRLHETDAIVDMTEYGLSELDKILGILLDMARGTGGANAPVSEAAA